MSDEVNPEDPTAEQLSRWIGDTFLWGGSTLPIDQWSQIVRLLDATGYKIVKVRDVVDDEDLSRALDVLK